MKAGDLDESVDEDGGLSELWGTGHRHDGVLAGEVDVVDEVGRGLDPGGRDGRSSSRRPGGPAPKRVATPTRPPAGHHGDSAEADGLDRR